ncbi:MAG: HD-GYP domain-containing protein, partial [Kineosporiaceae bacterium]
VGAVAGRWAVAGLAAAQAPLLAATALGVTGGVAVALLGRRAARPLLAVATLLDLGLTFPAEAPPRRALATRDVRPRAAVQRVRTSRTGTASDAAQAVVVLIAALSAHDRHGRYRTRRVRALTRLLADRLGIDGPQRDRLEWAALLHDVGKLTVATQILDKAGRPTPAQWDVLRRHPSDGAELVGPLLAWLGEWGAAIRHHHERWDGAGYPDGLAGEAIPRSARIVALADAWQSMTAARPYRSPMATRAAYAEVTRGRGSQFDPAVVDAFLAIPLRRLLRAGGPVALLANLPTLGALARIGQQGVLASAAPQVAMVAASTAVVLGGVAATGGLVPATGSAAGPATAAGPVRAASPTRVPSSTAPPTSRPTVHPTTVHPTTTRPATTRPVTTTTPPGPTMTGTPPRPAPSATTSTATSSTTTSSTTPPGPTTATPSPAPTTATATPSPAPDPDPDATTSTPSPAPTTATATPSPAPDPAATTAMPSPASDTGTTAASTPAPAPTFVVRTPAETTLRAAGFGWLVRPGLDYECSLDDQGWLPCDGRWFATYIDVETGRHRFAVRSVDPATGAPGAPARASWVVA